MISAPSLPASPSRPACSWRPFGSCHRPPGWPLCWSPAASPLLVQIFFSNFSFFIFALSCFSLFTSPRLCKNKSTTRNNLMWIKSQLDEAPWCYKRRTQKEIVIQMFHTCRTESKSQVWALDLGPGTSSEKNSLKTFFGFLLLSLFLCVRLQNFLLSGCKNTY